MKLTHYVVVRTDIPFGHQMAQLCHAAGESFKSPPKIRGEPIYAVVLSAKSEKELLELEQKFISFGVEHVSIREPDEPYFGQLMAIGLVPIERNRVSKFLSKLPLVK